MVGVSSAAGFAALDTVITTTTGHGAAGVTGLSSLPRPVTVPLFSFPGSITIDGMSRIIVIGGPNGAGKTTSATKLLPNDVHCREFVNADAIAAGLSAFRPESVAIQAGKLMLTRIKELTAKNVDFAFETTLAARSFAPFLREAKAAGYKINLLYLWLPTVELALERVAKRVQAGGHNIPERVVRRRFIMGLRNLLQLYLPLVDAWTVLDNSGPIPALIASMANGAQPVIEDLERWQSFQETAR